MISLFDEASEVSVLPFLENYKEQLMLIAAPEFLAALPGGVYASETETLKGVPVIAFGPDIDARLKGLSAEQIEGRVFVLAHSAGEGPALRALRAAHPDLRFAGLGEAVFPAIVAHRPKAILRGQSFKLKTTEIALIFATPRTGSSYVADVVSDCGFGIAREHLRNAVITVLTSDYKFNRGRALSTFLNLISTDGRAATKIISHFLTDYISMGAQDFEVLRRTCAGMKVRVIVLDRADKVGQAVSSFLAARRGVWHVRSENDAEKLGQSASVGYDFNALLARYMNYRQQSAILEFAREVFPDHLELEYDRDVVGTEPEELAQTLAPVLQDGSAVTVVGTAAANRQRLANAENDAFCARFIEDYRALCGVDP